ncbi:MAG TPA: SulP family inorganic anion transporter [Armatimonadetes bacterium]|nr:SulP family inorganic anion transporter [Nitrospira sp.]HAY13329.1 SulP family inorganic anion transporter [Armatimonadota bacterium]HRI81553.1 SulP family inorganic anion transporter [Opitutaceae bacterium]HRJ46515.1 SulP family inorganic anion transporter [Opitutaceae bacterium]
MQEFTELKEVAGDSATGIGKQIRANLIPPLCRALPDYDRANFRADLLAGVTVAVITIPQSIAFALLIGIPLSSVLAGTFIVTVLCSFYCSSRHLVVGPTNTISIILAGALYSLASEPQVPLQKVLLIGFFMGAIQLAAGLANFGKITQYVSRSVIVGYTTAVGILIATGQLGNLFGIARGTEVSLPGTLRHLATSFLTLHFNPVTAAIGVGSLATILALRRWRPRWPDGLPVLILAGALSAWLDLNEHGVGVVRDLGAISGGIPFFTGFPLNATGLILLPKVTSVAIAAALLGMLEAVTVAKTLAVKTGQRVNPSQELIGMGLGNLLGAGFGAMPGSASFLRSAANQQSGGHTQWAVILGSTMLLLIVQMLSPLLAHLPVAAIAAYLIVIAIRLIQPAQILVVRLSTSSDAAVFWVTLVAALFLDLDTAIYTGVGVSLVLFLQKAGAPSLVEHAFNEQGQLAQIASPAGRNNSQISIVHVEGDLFFGATDIFQDDVRRLAEDPHIRVFILRMKNARHLDATTVMALGQLLEYLQSQGRHLLISGVRSDVATVLKRSGLAARIGPENIFPAEENPTLATKRALQRAQQLLPGTKPDLRIFYDHAPQPTA